MRLFLQNIIASEFNSWLSKNVKDGMVVYDKICVFHDDHLLPPFRIEFWSACPGSYSLYDGAVFKGYAENNGLKLHIEYYSIIGRNNLTPILEKMANCWPETREEIERELERSMISTKIINKVEPKEWQKTIESDQEMNLYEMARKLKIQVARLERWRDEYPLIGKLTQEQIAKRFDVSEETIKKDCKDIRDRGYKGG